MVCLASPLTLATAADPGVGPSDDPAANLAPSRALMLVADLFGIAFRALLLVADLVDATVIGLKAAARAYWLPDRIWCWTAEAIAQHHTTRTRRS